MKKSINAGIIGAAGYTGGELMRLLVHHPYVNIAFAHSRSKAGKAIHEVHADLLGDSNLHFTNTCTDTDVLFLCLGHGEAKDFLEENAIPGHTKIIDLSQDFRLETGNKWQYGLPELNRDIIKSGTYNIANPGCFATSIQLALLPLAQSGMLNSSIHISATTGSTGAGQKLSDTSHFSWRNNNLSVYKAFEHQHIQEITRTLQQLQDGFNQEINFIPCRGNFTRGILSVLYTESDLNEKEIRQLFEAYYQEQPFVHLSSRNIDLKQVVNTNKCFLFIEKHKNKVMITSIIDNLIKGASGQAVQNMNLLFGFDETTGLKLKSSAF